MQRISLHPRFVNDKWSFDHTFRPRIVAYRSTEGQLDRDDMDMDQGVLNMDEPNVQEVKKPFEEIVVKFPVLKGFLKQDHNSLDDLFKLETFIGV